MAKGRINMQVLDYRITSDNYNYILSKVVRDPKTGEISMSNDKKAGTSKESTKAVGHYGTLEMLLKDLTREFVRNGDPSRDKEIKTIKDFRDEMEYITKLLEDRLALGE